MRDSGDDYWRSRAGVSAVKGVLAPETGAPGIAPLPAGAEAQVAANAPVRLARLSVDHPADLVRHVWIPRWRLPDGVVVEQSVLDYPSANLVIEPDSAAVYATEVGRSIQRLEGTGWAFGALLQPGVARQLVRDPMRALVGSSVRLAELRVTDAAAMARGVRAAAALAAPDAPSLAELAASVGFADQAHLTREFRAVIGETPRRYGLAARAVSASAHQH